MGIKRVTVQKAVKGEVTMQRDDDIEIEKRNVEKKTDSSKVASTFIKYAAYIIITFGILWFIAQYIIPQF